MKNKFSIILGLVLSLLIFKNGMISDATTMNKRSIPVLMYHHILNGKTSPYIIDTNKFEAEMKYLKDNNYNIISLDKLYSYMKYNTEIPKKSVVLTFDDGYLDSYQNVYPVLNRLKLKATFFIITDFIGLHTSDGDRYMNLKQIKKLQRSGMDIEAHSTDHEHMLMMKYDDQLSELKDSKDYLQEKLHKKIKYMAYPFGEYNDRLIGIARSVGYRIAFSIKDSRQDTLKNRLKLGRVYVNESQNMNEFKALLNENN